MAVSELTRAKTILVLAIVVGCFAVLWPKVFYPMFQGGVAPEPPPHHKDDASHMRPERPAHLHPDVLHPGLREKGRTMPPSHADAKQGRPPLGVRPPMGAGAHVGNTQKGVGAGGGGAMSIVMPIYTIGIVVFFVYTVMKVLFKKQPESSEEPQIKDFGMDPEHRKFLYEKVGDENVEFSSRSADDMQQRSRVSAAEPIIDPVVISTDKKDATISAPIPAPEEVAEVKQDQIIVDVQKQDKPVAVSLVAIRDQKEEEVSKVSLSEEASAFLISKDDQAATRIALLDKEKIQEAVVQPIGSIIAPDSTIFIQGENDVKAEAELLAVDAQIIEPLGPNLTVKEEVETVQEQRESPGDEAVKAEEPTKAIERSAESIPLVEGQVGVVSVDQEPSDVGSAFVVKEDVSPSSEETVKDEEPLKVVEETADSAITSVLDVTEEVAPVQAREDTSNEEAVKVEEPAKANEESAETVPLVEGQFGIVSVDQEPSDVRPAFDVKKDVPQVQAKEETSNEETVKDEEPAKVVEETADSAITSALDVTEEVAPVQAPEEISTEEAVKVEEPAKAVAEPTEPSVLESAEPALVQDDSASNEKSLSELEVVELPKLGISENVIPSQPKVVDLVVSDATTETLPTVETSSPDVSVAVKVEEPAKAVEPTDPSVLESAEPALVQDDSASNEKSLLELEVVELPKLDIISENVIPSEPTSVDLVVSDATTEILPTVDTSSPDVSITVSNVINETLQDTDIPSPAAVCEEKSNEDTESVATQSETKVLPAVLKSTDPETKQQESPSITVCDDLEITLTKSEDIRPTDPNTQESAPIQEEQFSKPDDVEQVSIASGPAEVTSGDVESVTKPIVVASEVDEPQEQETSYIPRDDVGNESLKDADSPAVEIVPIATDVSCDPTVLEPSALSSDSIVSEPAEPSLEPEKPEPSLLDPTFKDESGSAEELKQAASDDVLIISDPDKESSDLGGIELGCDGITEATEIVPLPESLGVDIDDDRLLEIESMIESDLSIFLDAPNIPITEVIAKPVTYARVSSRAVSVEDDEAEDVIEKVTIKPYVKSDAPEESGSHENVEDLIKQAITDEDVVVDFDSTPTSKSNDIQIDGNITVAPDNVVDVVIKSAGEICTVETPDPEILVINETSVCPLTFAVVKHTEANELGTDSVAAQEENLDHQSSGKKAGNVDPTTAVELAEKETSELNIVVEPEVLPTVASVVVSSVISDPSPQLSVDNMEDVVEKDIMLEVESLVEPEVLEVVQAAVESLTESSTAPAVSEAAATEVVDSTVVESPSINEPSEQLVENTADVDVIATEAEAVKEETTSKVESSVETKSLEAVEPVASEAAAIDSIENEKFPVEFEFEEEKTHGTDSNQSAEVVTNICDTVEVPQSCPEFSPLTTETSNTPEVFTALGAASEEIKQRESVGESSVKIGECCAGACLQEINLPKAAFVECPALSAEKTIENKLEDLRKQKELEMDLLRRRLEETEAAMERIVAQMGTASDKLLTRDQYDRAMKEESLPTSKGSSPDMEEYEVVKSDVLTSRLEPISSEEGKILADDKPITEECIRSSSESSSCEMLNKSGRDHSPSPSTETTFVPVSDVISDKKE